MLRLLKLWLTVQLLTCSSLAAFADDWAAGRQAYHDGDYAAALRYFEMVRNAGRDSPAVYYNIAVSQFKLGQFEEAGRTFDLIASRFPEHRALAEYNRGLVARRLGKPAEARAHFLRAYESGPDDHKLRVLASRRLREMEGDAGVPSFWTGAIGVRAGHDDNVALRDEAGLPLGTTGESPMVDLFASLRGPDNGRNGFRIDGSAYLVKYLDADEFDQAQVRGGVLHEWKTPDWRIHVGVHASAGTLGGDAFDRKVGADVSVNRNIGRYASAILRYSHDDVSDADPLFSGIAGTRRQFDARYRWYQNSYRFQVRFGLEANDRTDPGVSPERRRFSVDFRYQPESGMGYGAGIDFRSSEYDKLTMPREEDLLSLSAALTYAIRSDWLLLLELRHSDNDSTDATFSYERAQITLGAMKLF